MARGVACQFNFDVDYTGVHYVIDPFLRASMLALTALVMVGLAACDRQPDSPATSIPTPPVALTAPALSSAPSPTPPSPAAATTDAPTPRVPAWTPRPWPTPSMALATPTIAPSATPSQNISPATPWPSPTPEPTPAPSGPCGELCSAELWEGDATVESVQAELDHGADPAARDDDGTPVLAYAITFSNSPEIAKLLLEAGADPNAIDGYEGATSLHYAALVAAYAYHPHTSDRISGDVDDYAADAIEIIGLLLEHGADAATRDEDGQTALVWYIGNLAEQLFDGDKSHDPQPPDPRVVGMLLSHGAELSAEHEADALVMQYAMWMGADAEVIALLLDHGAEDARKAWDDWENTLLYLAAEFTADIEVFKLLLDRGEDVTAQISFGWTVLHIAVREKDIAPEVVRLLLDSGADIAAKADQGDTPLHHAASHSGPEVVRLLLERGADVTARDDLKNTPLHAAVSHGYRWAYTGAIAGPEVIGMLMENGADVNATNASRRTPLHSAALYQHTAATQLLLESGADINATDQTGNSPLHLAARLRESWEYVLPEVDVEFIELLLNAGADAAARNSDGDTPCDVASEDDENVRALLCP